MTTREVIKFKEQIKYYLEHPDDGMLIETVDGWEVTYDPSWMIKNKYVIPDKYKELRIASSEGGLSNIFFILTHL